MKRRNIFRTLAVLVTISLLLIALPSTPALAATISLSPTSGPVGTWVTVTGSLFTGLGGNTVFIFLDNDVRTSAVVTTTYETISAQFQIPTGTTTGQKTVSVKTTTSPSSTTLAIAYFTVTVIEIELDEDSGPVGTLVEITGEGFGDEEDLIVEYDDDDITDDVVSGSTETDDDGEFAFTIAIPESAAGDHTITVTGEESDTTASADFEVEPQITIAPDTGKRNDTIAINGTGFPDDEDITITFDGASVTTTPLSVESNSNGSFSATFVVPNSSGGIHTVKASHGTYDDTASFVVSATATLSQTTGYIGTEVTVSGTGFQANQYAKIYFDNTEISEATTVVAANGNVNTSFTVPSHAAGTFKVRITDQTNIIELDFQILTSAEISQTSGHVGS
ncbi:MAG: IPT/TIG domain-containing protein, partial [Dehalococcoidales bacterium]